jgi:hypothetical protein
MNFEAVSSIAELCEAETVTPEQIIQTLESYVAGGGGVNHDDVVELADKAQPPFTASQWHGLGRAAQTGAINQGSRKQLKELDSHSQIAQHAMAKIRQLSGDEAS